MEAEAEPALGPAGETHAFGVEDPRATRLGGKWWINYAAVSPWGIATAAAVTRDRRRLERRACLTRTQLL